jgi:hypothetical protein
MRFLISHSQQKLLLKKSARKMKAMMAKGQMRPNFEH